MDQSVLSRGAWATVLQNSGIMSILGDPEFQNPEFQAATVESGVDKDGKKSLIFQKGTYIFGGYVLQPPLTLKSVHFDK